MCNLLNKLSWMPLIMIAILLGLAPFSPQPHLVEKLGMLMQGTLVKPVDIFDLLMHAFPGILLVLKLICSSKQKESA